MGTTRFQADKLQKLLKKRKIATLPQLKDALGTNVDLTLFRKLKELGYRTSYSHRGAYYTLDQIARFDERGLWRCGAVCFSRYGTLLATAEAFVDDSEAGYYAGELENVLKVSVKDALLKLVRDKRIARRKVLGLYLYHSVKAGRAKKQIMARRVLESRPRSGRSVAAMEVVPDELKAAIILFFSVLNEKQLRLYAGLESLKLGRGGDQALAQLTGLDVHTVARGRRELLEQDFEPERVRKVGGGRKPLKKNARSDRAY